MIPAFGIGFVENNRFKRKPSYNKIARRHCRNDGCVYFFSVAVVVVRLLLLFICSVFFLFHFLSLVLLLSHIRTNKSHTPILTEPKICSYFIAIANGNKITGNCHRQLKRWRILFRFLSHRFYLFEYKIERMFFSLAPHNRKHKYPHQIRLRVISHDAIRI